MTANCHIHTDPNVCHRSHHKLYTDDDVAMVVEHYRADLQKSREYNSTTMDEMQAAFAAEFRGRQQEYVNAVLSRLGRDLESSR